ncbi:MAG: zinc-dependent alcohol dehydrogenase [Bacillota bacterium]|jgi:2-desacetyl-2-hydroxyethyl bacteriochlorophyllide A dehydrogenase
MKAAIITEKDKVVFQETEKPFLNEGEALIRVRYCGVCGSDVHIWKGEHATAKFPVIPGHEFVGTLEEIKGEADDNVRIGDMVVAQPFFSCGHCKPCSKGEDNVCKHLKFLGAHANGGFAEYVKVPIRKVFSLPEGTDPQIAALAEPLAVAVHDVHRSGLKVGESVLIIGGGTIGMLVAIVARMAGARQIVISEVSDSRRKKAEEMGFETIDPVADGNFDRFTDGNGFDVVFEVSGSRPGVATAIQQVTIYGMIVFVGMTKEPYPVDLREVFAKEIRIAGVRIHNQYSFMTAVEILKSGQLDDELKELISGVYSLENIEEAFSKAEKPGDFFKLLVSCGG